MWLLIAASIELRVDWLLLVAIEETPMRPTPVITAATMTPEMRLSASVKPSASLFLLDLFRSGDARSFMFISALLDDEWLDRMEPLEESI